MKRIIVLAFSIFFYLHSFSQLAYYAAAKAGLSIREQPNTSAKVLDKIPYGEKMITVVNNEQQVTISTEGFNGYWWKIKYKEKTGYIVSSYVLPLPPPRAGTKTLHDYFAQVSAPLGNTLVIKRSDAALNETGESTLTKQLYKNGMEWHKTDGYENASSLYMIPDITIEQCFLLVRLIGQYPELIGEKEVFPTKRSVVKNDNGEKIIDVEKELYDGPQGSVSKPGPVKKIKIGLVQGAVTEFEIYLLDTQAIIFWASGV
ncbi:MAG: SH3 domain-containing protein [Ferruginibacter sp.]